MASSWGSTPMRTCTTSWPICRRCASDTGVASPKFVVAPGVAMRCASVLTLGLILSLAVRGHAQDAKDSWTTYHGDYSGQRHSRLSQITPANVHQITLAWAFATGQTSQIKGTPILSNGIVYVTTPDNVWALDARSGRQVWHYTYPANEGF